MFKSTMFHAFIALASSTYLEAMEGANIITQQGVAEVQWITIQAHDGTILIEREMALESQIIRKQMAKSPESTICKIPSTTIQEWKLLIPILKELIAWNGIEQKAEKKKYLATVRKRCLTLSIQELRSAFSAADSCKIPFLKQFFKEILETPTKKLEEKRCFVCQTNEGTMNCGKCHLQNYCSTECQKKDWNRHKVDCVIRCTVCKSSKPTARCALCLLPYCKDDCKESTSHSKICQLRILVTDAYRTAVAKSYEDLFRVAITTDSEDVFNALLTLGYIIIQKGQCSSIWALHDACVYNRLAMARTLIERNVSVDAPDALGLTPLHFACKAGGTELVRLLIAKGAPVNAKNRIQEALPIHEACDKGHREIIEILLKANRKVLNSRTNEGLSPLLCVCDRGFFDLAKLFIETYRADKTATTIHGRNALHLACRGGSVDLVNYLLEAGFDKNARTEYNETPLFFAADAGHIDIVRCLFSRGADKTVVASNNLDALFMACAKGHLLVVQLFQETGKDLTQAITGNGSNLLHWACACGHEALVEYLVKQGVNLECSDLDGNTPVKLACKNNHMGVISCLAKKCGIVIDQKDLALIQPTILKEYLAVSQASDQKL